MDKPVKYDYKIKESSFKQKYAAECLNEEFVELYNLTFDDILKREQTIDDNSLLLELGSLKNATPELVDKIDERIKYIKVQDYYEGVKINSFAQNYGIKYLVKNSKKDNDYVAETHEDGINSSQIYSRDELKAILVKMQELEKGLENFDDFTKTTIIYDRLRKYLRYEYDDVEHSLNVRSLRPLLSGKAVCYGYAVILSQMLKRQNIKNQVISGNSHAWNNVLLNNRVYPMDLTWDSALYHSGCYGLESMKNFGNATDEFNDLHKPRFKTKYSLSSFNPKSVQRALGVSSLSSEFMADNKFMSFTRDDGTSFSIAQVETSNLHLDEKGEDVKLYTYVYGDKVNGKIDKDSLSILHTNQNIEKLKQDINASSDDTIKNWWQNTLNCCVNDLFSKKNIKKCKKMRTSYLGDVEHSIKKPNTFEITRNKEIARHPKVSTLYQRNVNGAVVSQHLTKTGLYSYHVYNTDDKKLNSNIIYSEQNLLGVKDKTLEQILQPEILNEFAINNAGYIGQFDQNGELVQDPKMLSRFQNLLNERK